MTITEFDNNVTPEEGQRLWEMYALECLADGVPPRADEFVTWLEDR